MKKRIYNLIEKGSYGSRINLIFDYLIVSLIILNVVAAAIDTLTGLPLSVTTSLKVFEAISIGIFSIEFILRVYILI